MYKYALSIALLISLHTTACAEGQIPRLAVGVIDTTLHETLGLKPVDGISTYTVFQATDVTDHYANGVVMTAFKGAVYCMWQSSPKDEAMPQPPAR